MSGEPREDEMHATNHTIQQLTIRVGVGDHAAFRRLYAILAPDALVAVRADLPDPTHAMHVVRATFCEVWWMSAFDLRCGCRRDDVPKWISTIAERRSSERRLALNLIITDELKPRGRFWADLLADRDQRTQFELAFMLDGHDTIRLPAPSVATRSPSAQATAT
jgi:hypothetical protein